MRYTDVRLTPLSLEWLSELAHGGVEFSDPHADRSGEPLVLPVSIPQLLLNGAQDVRSDGPLLPPYNLGEICDAVLALLDDPMLPQEELHRLVPAPDFPTGGMLAAAGVRETLQTGRGSLTLRGRVDVQQRAGQIALVVTELPYGSPRALLEELSALMRRGSVMPFNDVVDCSDADGLAFELRLRPGASVEHALAVLSKLDSFQRTLRIEHKVLIAGVAEVVPLRRLLEEFITFRKALLRRAAQRTATQARERLAIIAAIRWAAGNFEELAAELGEAATSVEAAQHLRQRHAWTDAQIHAVIHEALAATLPDNRRRLEEEHAALLARHGAAEAVMTDETTLVELMRRQVHDVRRRYADKRRTQIEVSTAVPIPVTPTKSGRS